jgi:hypothetical protein
MNQSGYDQPSRAIQKAFAQERDKPMNSKVKIRALLSAGAVALACGAGAIAAGPAQASGLSCSDGYNNANQAWGTCSGSGTWRLTVDCYYWGANSTNWYTQEGGTHSLYATCPSFSHVTSIYVQQQS